MRRKDFLMYIEFAFSRTFWGKTVFHIENEKAEAFHEVVKSSDHLDCCRFIAAETDLANFLSLRSLTLVTGWEKRLDIEYEIDEYMLEDEGKFSYKVSFDSNELFDLTEHEYCEGFKTVEVYRIEDDEQNGCYFANLLPGRTVLPNQTTPSEDGEISLVFDPELKASKTPYSEKWIFGFLNTEDIDRWFGKEDTTEVLDKISVYSVSEKHLLKGKIQIAFNKEYAKFKGRYIE